MENKENNKNNEHSVRIQTSLLNAAEKKALLWLAERQPKWVNSDILTYIGHLGSIIIALGFVLSCYSVHFLWVSVFGFFVNWYGDSLDGTLARFRNQQRPTYGYYIDHTVDVINEAIMFMGVGLSPFMRFDLACVVFAVYLMLTINVSMNAHLKGEFRLTYAKLGPTEFRLVCIVACILLIGVKSLRTFALEIPWKGDVFTMNILDVVGFIILFVLVVIYFLSIIQDAKYYAKIDPKRKDD